MKATKKEAVMINYKNTKNLDLQNIILFKNAPKEYNSFLTKNNINYYISELNNINQYNTNAR